MKSIFLLLFIFIASVSNAQVSPQVVNTAGMYLKGQNSWFDMSIGELITTSAFSSTHCATQGYLQPKLPAPNNQVAFVETLSVAVYPNPFTSLINITTERTDLKFVVTTMTGQNISSTQEKSIDLSNYPSGIYLLSIYNAQNEILAIHKLCKLTN